MIHPMQWPPDDSEPPTVGDHPPTERAITAALADVREPLGSPDQRVSSSSDGEAVKHVVAAISGNSDVDAAVCKAAKTVLDITRAHVHFVSVITQVSDPAEHAILAPAVDHTIAPQVGIRSLEDEQDLRKQEFAEFARRCTSPNSYSPEIRTGLIDDEIIKAADESNASLIIVGSGEKTWLDGILSTDVAREVTAKATRPVLVVPENASEDA